MKKYLRSIRKKLRGKAGETISETLISLLIASLALVMLAGAVAAGSAMITKSRIKLEDYYTKNEKLAAVAQPAAGDSKTGSLDWKRVSGKELSEKTISVVYAENDAFSNKKVVSYLKSTA